MDAIFQEAQAKGMQIFVASGDSGSDDGESSPITDYPASSPYVIACGGTRLTIDSKGNKVSETSWSETTGNGASGGGYTDLYPTPSNQVEVAKELNLTGRIST